MYIYTGNQKALEVSEHFADWFVEWSGKYSRDKFDDILDVETGGMLEVWADLLKITGKEKYNLLTRALLPQQTFSTIVGRERSAY